MRIGNRATGLHPDGLGRTGGGSGPGRYADSGSANQQWKIVAAG
ncbi:hypothetical protein [Microbispora sp. NBC_01389]